MSEVDSVAHAGSIREAWEDPALLDADLVILDTAVAGGRDFIAAVSETADARVLVCTSECGEDAVISAMQAGAVGFLRKDSLTPASPGGAASAAAAGSGGVAPQLLRRPGGGP